MWLTGCVLSASEGCKMCVMYECFCVFVCLHVREKIPYVLFLVLLVFTIYPDV